MTEAIHRLLDECVSTNDLARELAEAGAGHGSWVSARRQRGGRGRLGRRWASEEGNLFLSIVARPGGDKARWSWIPLAAAVGAALAARRLDRRLEVRIKWPNDLWLRGSKVGGILCEASGDFIVIGIGLNCLSHPEGLDQPTTSLTLGRGGEPISAGQARLPVVEEVLAAVARVGERWLARRYDELAVFKPGTAIEWAGIRGTVESLGPSGELLARRASDGERVRIFADDVTGPRACDGSPA